MSTDKYNVQELILSKNYAGIKMMLHEKGICCSERESAILRRAVDLLHKADLQSLISEEEAREYVRSRAGVYAPHVSLGNWICEILCLKYEKTTVPLNEHIIQNMAKEMAAKIEVIGTKDMTDQEFWEHMLGIKHRVNKPFTTKQSIDSNINEYSSTGSTDKGKI
jgi:hypothetical protein